jgi:hypothetical protein
MKHRIFGTHSQAVAGVIEALLMVALVSVVISIIQLQYVPQVMEEKEAQHMDQVFNQFSSLKSMIDIQSTTRSSAPISSMITLGSGGLPYFITEEAQGSLEVDDSDQYRMEIFPEPLTPPPGLEDGMAPLTSIIYEAGNFYFVNPYFFILEGGGIIKDQPGEQNSKPVMVADPSISAINNSNSITLHINLPRYIGILGKKGTYGMQQGNSFIRTNYSSNITYTQTLQQPGGYIHIYTAYPNAWNESLYNILGIYTLNGYISIEWISADPIDYIEIKPIAKEIHLQLNVINIYVQIGQGIIL